MPNASRVAAGRGAGGGRTTTDMRHGLIFGLAAALAPLPAAALDISGRGPDIYLTGSIELGSHARFERFLIENPGATFRTVHLNSPGGWSGDMREIARDIRRRGLNTAVDGSRAVCASACTVLFAAGVQRFYYNADRVPEGVRKADRSPGLGYHGANNAASTILMARQSPGVGMQGIINMYYELGSSAAADLANRAEPSQLYKIGGRTAVSLGLATSTSRP
jgi:hypothetical protein